MKKLGIFLLLMFLWIGVAFADSNVTFGWDPNPESDLVGYKLYQSETSGGQTRETDGGVAVSIIPAGTETITISVQDGTWFWVLTAYDDGGNESGFSNEVTAVLDTESPGTPQGFTVTVIIKVETP